MSFDLHVYFTKESCCFPTTYSRKRVEIKWTVVVKMTAKYGSLQKLHCVGFAKVMPSLQVDVVMTKRYKEEAVVGQHA